MKKSDFEMGMLVVNAIGSYGFAKRVAGYFKPARSSKVVDACINIIAAEIGLVGGGLGTAFATKVWDAFDKNLKKMKETPEEKKEDDDIFEEEDDGPKIVKE